MKIIQKTDGKKVLSMSQEDWLKIGEKEGWTKSARMPISHFAEKVNEMDQLMQSLPNVYFSSPPQSVIQLVLKIVEILRYIEVFSEGLLKPGKEHINLDEQAKIAIKHKIRSIKEILSSRKAEQYITDKDLFSKRIYQPLSDTLHSLKLKLKRNQTRFCPQCGNVMGEESECQNCAKNTKEITETPTTPV